MITNDQRLNEIINYFGDKQQVIKAIEEMAELTKELCKGSKKDKILEELSDVLLMCEQVRLIYNIPEDDIENAIRKKINRTIMRIEAERHKNDLTEEAKDYECRDTEANPN